MTSDCETHAIGVLWSSTTKTQRIRWASRRASRTLPTGSLGRTNTAAGRRPSTVETVVSEKNV
ncbi:unnamed protein product [Haemonchus placei]|uniref:Uncharacterized protein n=1 Tax=Haemonchus placei TaxID=6290 RepID=A0A0N4WP12_HAEPC|nr:unnamed protein product [Haemonchus placei]